MPLSTALEASRATKARLLARPYLVTDNTPPKPAKRGGRPPRKAGAPTHRVARPELTRADVRELFVSLNFARHVPAGRAGCFAEPNLFVTTTWGLTGWRDRAAPDCIREILQRCAQFLRRAGEPMVWAYNQEVGPEKGLHWHLVIYVPAPLQRKFRKRFRAWLRSPAAGGHIPRGTAVVFKAVWCMHGLKQYLAKEAPDDVRAEYGIPDTASYARTGGVVMGKRLAVSPSINRTARLKAGWEQSAGGGNVVQFTAVMRRAA